jgi:hypothetical protein
MDKMKSDYEDYKDIVPPMRTQAQWHMYLHNYKRVKDQLELCDPPKVQEVNEEALKALGLNDFVHLDLLPAKDQNKDQIVEFIAFFGKGKTVLRHNIIDVKKLFRTSLKLPSAVPIEVPGNVPHTTLTETARELLNAYALQKSTRKEAKAAKTAITNGMAHTIDFSKVIESEALHELNILAHNTAMTPKWKCFYSAFWQKLIDDFFEGYDNDAPPSSNEDGQGNHTQSMDTNDNRAPPSSYEDGQGDDTQQMDTNISWSPNQYEDDGNGAPPSSNEDESGSPRMDSSNHNDATENTDDDHMEREIETSQILTLARQIVLCTPESVVLSINMLTECSGPRLSTQYRLVSTL